MFVFSAEIFVIIICGSIPTLKPIVDQICGRRTPKSASTPNSNGAASSSRFNYLEDSNNSGQPLKRPTTSTWITGRAERDLWADDIGDEQVDTKDNNDRTSFDFHIGKEGAEDVEFLKRPAELHHAHPGNNLV